MAESNESTVETVVSNLTNEREDGSDNTQSKHAAATATDNPVVDWCRATAVRAVKTAAQTMLAVVGTGMVGILDVDWANCLSVTLMATLLSVVTSVAGLPEVDGGTSVAKLGKV